MAPQKLDILGQGSQLMKEVASTLRPERRGEPRAVTYFRPVVIEVGPYSGFSLLKNLSSTGMMAIGYTELEAGRDIVVRFDGETTVKGKIAWIDGERYGVQFAETVALHSLMERLRGTEARSGASRPPRVEINVPCTIRTTTSDFSSTALNISQRGVAIKAFDLREHDEVRVVLKDVGSRKAIVRWCREGFAGLTFATPWDFEELARWVAKMNPQASDGI